MNIKILKAAVSYMIGQPTISQEENKELVEVKRWLELIEHQRSFTTNWQQLNNLDHALLQLYKHCDFDTSTEEGFLLELNGQPLVLDFNPAAFADLQRLLHRQIAISYTDNLE